MAERSHSGSSGTTFADARERYRLDTRVATGGMGEVWRATDTVLGRPVAVKLLKQEHADDPVFRSRFETEAHNAAGLHHTGVAQVFDFGAGDPDHPPFLVMEYVDGQPLSALLRPGEPMDPAATATLVAAVGDALGAAHAHGIVHRDVKPSNILVTDDHHMRITDFGIARAADAVTLTRSGEVLGTPQYISPEQAEGRPATPASDVYSLGVVAFECLAGHRPFQAETPVATAVAHLRAPIPHLPESVPPALADVVRRALAKDPAQRYAEGRAFAAAVRAAIETPAGSLPPAAVGPVPVPVDTQDLDEPAAVTGSTWRSRLRRVPLPLWVAAVVLVVILAIAALAATTSGGYDGAPVDQRTPSSSTPTAPASTPATNPDDNNNGDDNSGPGNGGGDDNSGPGNGGGDNNSGQGSGRANGHGKAKGHSKHGEGDQ
jgi:eukaryotic-like serine/threonine-protein kinase